MPRRAAAFFCLGKCAMPRAHGGAGDYPAGRARISGYNWVMRSDSSCVPELSDRATEAWLRQRFAGGQAVTPIATGDGHLWRPADELRPAAVLVPVVRREAGLTILLTQRTDHL